VPISALVLPACLVPTLLILRRVHHNAAPNDDPLIPPLPRYVALLFIPLVASATYALLLGTRIELQTLFGIVLIPLGFLLLVVALWRVWGRA
jgi:hypothetical protein